MVSAVKSVLAEYSANKSGDFYEKGLENLVSRWKTVATSGGKYTIPMKIKNFHLNEENEIIIPNINNTFNMMFPMFRGTG